MNENKLFMKSASSFFEGFLTLCPWINRDEMGGNISPWKPPTSSLVVVPGQTNLDIIEMLLDELAKKATKVSAATTVTNLNTNIEALKTEITAYVNGLK